MTKREKIPHTASFLQTFHTAGGRAPQYRPEPVDETSALTFLAGGRTARPEADRLEWRGFSVRQDHVAGDLTEKQAKYVISIALDSDGVTPEMLESLKVRLQQGFAKYAASQFITRYKDLPRKHKQQPTAGPKVVKGYYAVTLPGEDNLRFFRINPGREGWTGPVFVDEVAGPEMYPVWGERHDVILETIAGDADAGARYGREIGKCCKCHRRLTDATSREMGIGPDCRSK